MSQKHIKFVLFKVHFFERLIQEKENAPSLLNRFSIHGTDINLLLLALNFKYKEILRRRESLEWVMGSLLSLSSKLRMKSSIVLCMNSRVIWVCFVQVYLVERKKTRLAVHEVKLWPLDGFLLFVENGTNWGPGCGDLELGLKCQTILSVDKWDLDWCIMMAEVG